MQDNTFNKHKVCLVETDADLALVDGMCVGATQVGCRVYTTGADYDNDNIVGVALATGRSYLSDDYVGYYIPLRHLGYDNVDLADVVKVLSRVLAECHVIFWDRNVDVSFLEREGVVLPPFVGGMESAQVLCHLVYNQATPDLYEYAKTQLRFEVVNYSVGVEGGNYGYTNPALVYTWCGSDAVMIGLLGQKVWGAYPYVRSVYALDNACLEALRQLSRSAVNLDYAYLEGLLATRLEALGRLEREIYSYVGYVFNLNSIQDKVDALTRFVTLTRKTRQGKFRLDADILRELHHPLADMMVRWGEECEITKKGIQRLLEFKGRVVRFNYSGVASVSGRIATLNNSDNSYYVDYNIHSTPKDKAVLYLRPHEVLGFCLGDDIEGACIGADGKPIEVRVKAGLRKAFKACGVGRENWVWVSADYAGQEMALMANFSRDELLLEPLRGGDDLYTNLSQTIFKGTQSRDTVKVAALMKSYGAGDNALANKLSLPLEVARQISGAFDKGLFRFTQWVREVIKSSKKSGFTKTYFGRQIYLGKYFNSSSGEQRAYGERLAVNGKVQGCLPACSYVGVDGSAMPLRSNIGKRIGFAAGGATKLGVPTFQGVSSLYVTLFNGGDFCVSNWGHKFVEYGSKKLLVGLEVGKRVVKVGCGRKVSVFKDLFSREHYDFQNLAVFTGLCRTLPLGSGVIARQLLKAYLGRKTIVMNNFVSAWAFRTFVDLYGFNLVYVPSQSKTGALAFRLRWGRCRKGVIKDVQMLIGGHDNVVSPSMISGYQTYSLGGFVHKNTGADIMRMDLIRLAQLGVKSSVWRDNVAFQSTIHDEVNYVVNISKLDQVCNILHKVMDFKPSNFEVGVHIELSVGVQGWGDCMPVSEVRNMGDGRMLCVPKGVDIDTVRLSGGTLWKNWWNK